SHATRPGHEFGILKPLGRFEAGDNDIPCRLWVGGSPAIRQPIVCRYSTARYGILCSPQPIEQPLLISRVVAFDDGAADGLSAPVTKPEFQVTGAVQAELHRLFNRKQSRL